MVTYNRFLVLERLKCNAHPLTQSQLLASVPGLHYKYRAPSSFTRVEPGNEATQTLEALTGVAPVGL